MISYSPVPYNKRLSTGMYKFGEGVPRPAQILDCNIPTTLFQSFTMLVLVWLGVEWVREGRDESTPHSWSRNYH